MSQNVFLLIMMNPLVCMLLKFCYFIFSRWEPTALEKCLLSSLVYSLPPASSYEIPVYLSDASNKDVYRLMIFQLMESIKVAVLCAAEPSLEQALSHVVQFWSKVSDNIKHCLIHFLQ